MLVTTLLMYLCSAGYLFLDFVSFLSTAHDPLLHASMPPDSLKKQSVAPTALLGINVSHPHQQRELT